MNCPTFAVYKVEIVAIKCFFFQNLRKDFLRCVSNKGISTNKRRIKKDILDSSNFV